MAGVHSSHRKGNFKEKRGGQYCEVWELSAVNSEGKTAEPIEMQFGRRNLANMTEQSVCGAMLNFESVS